MKKAKLVYVSLVVRVVVNENATDEQIMEETLPKFILQLNEDGLLDHLENIKDDTECPYKALESPYRDKISPKDFEYLDGGLNKIVDTYNIVLDRENEPLDGDDVDRFVEILRAKLNLHQGNITENEFNKIEL